MNSISSRISLSILSVLCIFSCSSHALNTKFDIPEAPTTIRPVEPVRPPVRAAEPVKSFPRGSYRCTVRNPDGSVAPAPGYRWVSNDDNNFNVTPRTVISERGTTVPEAGFRFVSNDPGDFRVEPRPGTRHPRLANVVWADGGTFVPANGYRWAEPNSPHDYNVVRE